MGKDGPHHLDLTISRPQFEMMTGDPVSKVAIIGFGSQAYVTDRGVQVVPLDVLAP